MITTRHPIFGSTQNFCSTFKYLWARNDGVLYSCQRIKAALSGPQFPQTYDINGPAKSVHGDIITQSRGDHCKITQTVTVATA